MALEIGRYDVVDEFGPVTKLQRDVETPLPDGEKEENRMVCYETNSGHQFKVFKVTDVGWTVNHYIETELEDMYMDYQSHAKDAHAIARAMVMDTVGED